MPASRSSLTTTHTARHVREHVLRGGEPARRVGLELEWITVSRRMPVLGPEQLRALLPDPLPAGSLLTFEPGGQLELSGTAHLGAAAACAAMASDVAFARTTLDAHGVELHGIGLDPGHDRPRVVHAPRYDAMERYFDTRWPAGRTMMRQTAATQVNLDLGTPDDVDDRWRRAHALGPVLAAAFANSPIVRGRPSGWKSARLAAWHAIDPSRTAEAARPRLDAADAWHRYALEAPVMMIRVDDRRSVPLTGPLTFARWIEQGHELGWPTIDDFELHLTTLFPPIRPRGHLELRMIDALPDEWWPVAATVTATLLDDPDAAERVDAATIPVRSCWTEAARDGLTCPALGAAARRCFAVARERMEAVGCAPELVEATDAFVDRYVGQARCPADDRLREWSLRPTKSA